MLIQINDYKLKSDRTKYNCIVRNCTGLVLTSSLHNLIIHVYNLSIQNLIYDLRISGKFIGPSRSIDQTREHLQPRNLYRTPERTAFGTITHIHRNLPRNYCIYDDRCREIAE